MVKQPRRHAGGYTRIYVPGHPAANSDGYALEHRLVLHEAGISVPKGWHVHHLDGDKTNNALDNLAVLSESAHHRLHAWGAGVATNQYGTFPVQEHGPSAYTRGCRCDVCRAANTQRCLEYRARRKERT